MFFLHNEEEHVFGDVHKLHVCGHNITKDSMSLEMFIS
jgi:hypothetical protein